jgi:predicted flap endonuclease-1-like 5' DNA nuclease
MAIAWLLDATLPGLLPSGLCLPSTQTWFFIMLKKHYSETKPVCHVTFTLPREATRGGLEVRILGEFNDWSWERGTPMLAGGTEFTATIELPADADYQFRYLIDNHVWENDWHADNYLPTPFGVYNSVISLHEVTVRPAELPAEHEPAPQATPAPKSAKAPGVRKKAAPAAAVPKAPAKPDDLTVIEGIGPKIAGLLQAAGIDTFARLGAANVTALRAVLEAAGKRYQLHDPSTWAQQSKLAAAGSWDALTKLQDKLKGGKA